MEAALVLQNSRFHVEHGLDEPQKLCVRILYKASLICTVSLLERRALPNFP